MPGNRARSLLLSLTFLSGYGRMSILFGVKFANVGTSLKAERSLSSRMGYLPTSAIIE